MGETREKHKGLFHRFLTESTMAVKRADGQPNTLSFSASSELPVERWYGMEVLSHEKGAVDLSRADGGAMPLLFNHDTNDPIGMITAASVTGGRLMVEASLFSTDRATEVQRMIDGGLRNVSIAYRVDVLEENVKTNTFTATEWSPYEVSIVTVPADASVGIGRSESNEYEIRMIRAAHHPIIKETPMATETVVTEEPAKKLSAIEAERERRQAIVNLCRANKIDARVEASWIDDGTPLTSIANQILDVMEERGKAKPMTAAALGLSSTETRKYSLFRALRALRYGGNAEAQKEAAFEIECSRAVAKQIGRVTNNMLVPSEVLQRPLGPDATARAMSAVPGSKGGYMVSVDNMDFIQILRNRSVAMAMGARVLSGLSGNVTFPRQTGKPTVTWQAGEGTSVTAADQTLGQLSMTPKTCIAITDVSEQLLMQASPSAEAFVMADLAADVAIDGIDAATINGLGGAQPLGIKNTPGVTTGQDSATATYAKILAFVSQAGSVNAILGNPGFVTNTLGAARLMQVQRFTSTDTPLWVGNMLNGQCVGFNAMSSEQLPAANLIFGSWDQLVIGEWGVLELSTDNGGTRFNQAQVGIRAMWMVDVLVRYPQAFIVSTNLS